MHGPVLLAVYFCPWKYYKKKLSKVGKYGLDVCLYINFKSDGRFSQVFAAFSENLNFMKNLLGL